MDASHDDDRLDRGSPGPAPTFSQQVRAEIEQLCTRYPTRQAALIPTLFIAQREFGYLSPAVMEMVAEVLDVPAVKVIATAKFYTMLRKEPIGRVHVQVCKNISCYLRRSDDVMEAFEDELGVACGGTTPDGCFTLSEVECLAACGRAPVVQVNETYHEWVTPEEARAIIAAHREELAKNGGPS